MSKELTRNNREKSRVSSVFIDNRISTARSKCDFGLTFFSVIWLTGGLYFALGSLLSRVL